MDADAPRIADFVRAWAASPFAAAARPWSATRDADSLLAQALARLDGDYRIEDGVAVHRLAAIEAGAVVKPPAILGPHVLVAANAYLRGGVFLDAGCIVGPCCELKTVFLFASSKVAHLSFVGDAVVGSDVNVEAGAIVANYRNERDDKRIRIRRGGAVIETGVEKFGALVGDGARIGANAVIAPGALIDPGSRIARLALVDQSPEAG